MHMHVHDRYCANQKYKLISLYSLKKLSELTLDNLVRTQG